MMGFKGETCTDRAFDFNLNHYKKHMAKVARELMYSDEVIAKIRKATSKDQVNTIMTTARKES